MITGNRRASGRKRDREHAGDRHAETPCLHEYSLSGRPSRPMGPRSIPASGLTLETGEGIATAAETSLDDVHQPFLICINQAHLTDRITCDQIDRPNLAKACDIAATPLNGMSFVCEALLITHSRVATASL